MNYRNAKRLENGWIDCEIEHEDYGWIPFTCNPNDTGAEFDAAKLHAEMNADPDTEAYVPPTLEEVTASAAADVRAHRDNLLVKHVDAVVSNPLRWNEMTSAQQGEIIAYRRTLLDIPDRPSFPFEIIWPEPPSFTQ
jgi:hypothetical protein